MADEVLLSIPLKGYACYNLLYQEVAEISNLASQMNSVLSQDVLVLLRRVANLVIGDGVPLYLVGGLVRDLLLKVPSRDVDIVVVGDALTLARSLSDDIDGAAKIHRRFGTATVSCKNLSVDMVTARSEVYSRPGALPDIRPGSIDDDLKRRDFAINAMAIRLDYPHYGELIDPYGGRQDLTQRVVRVLHKRSFVDDATRILRALRYEQRLGFHLEWDTEALLRRDVPALSTISGNRICHELEIILREEQPEKVVERMNGLGVWRSIFTPLDAEDDKLSERFERARRVAGGAPSLSMYLSLLVYNLTESDVERFILFFRIQKMVAKVIRDAVRLKSMLGLLDGNVVLPSVIYRALCSYSPTAILAVDVAEGDSLLHRHLNLYLKRLRYVRTLLDGEALLGLGVNTGPLMGKILGELKDARLDGRVTSVQDEVALVKHWL
ncbi:MAG: CCA tRNA nucleotidyltransferase [Dehalococcoidia bacterium]|nr:CCA tRNA nucleotidyltransferase [Dehalococcoidia bacterium]